MNDVEQSIGHTLGYESVEKTVEQIERYCEYEKKRIESANLAPLKAGRAELALLFERKEQLEGRIRQLPPSGDIRMRRRQAFAYWALVAVLVMAGTYFTKLSFDPFRSANQSLCIFRGNRPYDHFPWGYVFIGLGQTRRPNTQDCNYHGFLRDARRDGTSGGNTRQSSHAET